MVATSRGWLRKGLLIAASSVCSITASPATAQTIDPDRPAVPMQWLLTVEVSRPELTDRSKWSKAENDLAQAHFEYLTGLAKRGAVIFGGRTYDLDPSGRMAPGTVGVIVVEAPDRQSAMAIVEADPAVKHGLFTARLQSYAIVVQR